MTKKDREEIRKIVRGEITRDNDMKGDVERLLLCYRNDWITKEELVNRLNGLEKKYE